MSHATHSSEASKPPPRCLPPPPRLSFDVWFFPPREQIQCTGVSSLALVDFKYAKKKLRSSIKLLGTAVLSADGAKLSVFVFPVLVSLERPVSAAAAAAGHQGSPVSVQAQVWCQGVL